MEEDDADETDCRGVKKSSLSESPSREAFTFRPVEVQSVLVVRQSAFQLQEKQSIAAGAGQLFLSRYKAFKLLVRSSIPLIASSIFDRALTSSSFLVLSGGKALCEG